MEQLDGTHVHICIFCQHIYSCANVHDAAHGRAAVQAEATGGSNKARPGGRCCTRCRQENMQMLDKLEDSRRRRLYQ